MTPTTHSQAAIPKPPSHPEPHSLTWSRLELETIEDYGVRCFEAGRAELARPQEVASDLQARCTEKIRWQDTGILRGSALRNLAAKIDDDGGSSLQRAESQTAREAMELAASRAQEVVRAEPVAVIAAAEKFAANYDGDDRVDIKTDVLNAFYAGSKFAATPPGGGAGGDVGVSQHKEVKVGGHKFIVVDLPETFFEDKPATPAAEQGDAKS